MASGLLVRKLPSDPRVVTATVTVLPAYGALLGYLLCAFRGTDPHLSAARNRVLAGCLLGFTAAAVAHAWGLLARSMVPFGMVIGGGAAFVLTHRGRRSS